MTFNVVSPSNLHYKVKPRRGGGRTSNMDLVAGKYFLHAWIVKGSAKNIFVYSVNSLPAAAFNSAINGAWWWWWAEESCFSKVTTVLSVLIFQPLDKSLVLHYLQLNSLISSYQLSIYKWLLLRNKLQMKYWPLPVAFQPRHLQYKVSAYFVTAGNIIKVEAMHCWKIFNKMGNAFGQNWLDGF